MPCDDGQLFPSCNIIPDLITNCIPFILWVLVTTPRPLQCDSLPFAGEVQKGLDTIEVFLVNLLDIIKSTSEDTFTLSNSDHPTFTPPNSSQPIIDRQKEQEDRMQTISRCLSLGSVYLKVSGVCFYHFSPMDSWIYLNS